MTENLSSNKYNMISVPFNSVGNEGIKLDDIKIEGFATGTDWNECDWFMIWKPKDSDYDSFYYYDDGHGDEGWYVAGDFSYTDTFDSLYPNGIPAGKPFWFLPSAKVDPHPDVKIKFFNPMKK